MSADLTEARELVAELKRLGLVTETKSGEYRLRSKGESVREFLNALFEKETFEAVGSPMPAVTTDCLVAVDPRQVRETLKPGPDDCQMTGAIIDRKAEGESLIRCNFCDGRVVVKDGIVQAHPKWAD